MSISPPTAPSNVLYPGFPSTLVVSLNAVNKLSGVKVAVPHIVSDDDLELLSIPQLFIVEDGLLLLQGNLVFVGDSSSGLG